MLNLVNNIIVVYFKNGQSSRFEQVGRLEIFLDEEIRFEYSFQGNIYQVKFFLKQISGYAVMN